MWQVVIQEVVECHFRLSLEEEGQQTADQVIISGTTGWRVQALVHVGN
jgi:hypothetical protein